MANKRPNWLIVGGTAAAITAVPIAVVLTGHSGIDLSGRGISIAQAAGTTSPSADARAQSGLQSVTAASPVTPSTAQARERARLEAATRPRLQTLSAGSPETPESVAGTFSADRLSAQSPYSSNSASSPSSATGPASSPQSPARAQQASAPSPASARTAASAASPRSAASPPSPQSPASPESAD